MVFCILDSYGFVLFEKGWKHVENFGSAETRLWWGWYTV